jgi:hypothetical protein
MSKKAPTTSYSSSSSSSDLDVLKQVFLSRLGQGIVMTLKNLKDYARKRKLVVSSAQIQKIKRSWPYVAKFETMKRKPKYMSASILKFGTLMIDIGFIEDHKAYNKNISAFLVGKEIVSGCLGAVELRNKSSSAIYEGLQKMLNKKTFNQIHTIVMDREAAVKSEKFKRRLLSAYGISTHHIVSRNKAYLAENGIHYVKKQIGMKIAATGDRRWIGPVLQTIVENYNNQKIPNTTFRRDGVTRRNTLKFLSQKYKLKYPSLLFNSATILGSDFKSKKWKKNIFRFDIGDKVLLAKKVYFKEELKKKSRRNGEDSAAFKPYARNKFLTSAQFLKPSLTGGYSDRVYTIKSRYLKSNLNYFWAILYRLKELPQLQFYQS